MSELTFEELLNKFGDASSAAKKRIKENARKEEEKKAALEEAALEEAALEKVAREAKKKELTNKPAQEEVLQPVNLTPPESTVSKPVNSETSKDAENNETLQKALQKTIEKPKKRLTMLESVEAFLEKYSNPEDNYIDYLNLLEKLGIISKETQKLLTGITLSEVAKQLKAKISNFQKTTNGEKVNRKKVRNFAQDYNNFKGKIKALFELKKQLNQIQSNTALQKEKRTQLKEQLGEKVVKELSPQDLVLLTNPYLSETLLCFAEKYREHTLTSFPDKAASSTALSTIRLFIALLSRHLKENKAIAAAQTVDKLVKKQQEQRETIKKVQEIYNSMETARRNMRSNQEALDTLDTLDTLYNKKYLTSLAVNKIITPEDALLLSNQSAKDLWNKTNALRKEGEQLLQNLANGNNVRDSKIQDFKEKVEECHKAIEKLLEETANVEKFNTHKDHLEEKRSTRREERKKLLKLPNSPWTIEKVNTLKGDDLAILSFLPYFQEREQENRKNLEKNRAWLEEAKKLHKKIKYLEKQVKAAEGVVKSALEHTPKGLERERAQNLMTQYETLLLNANAEDTEALKQAITPLLNDNSIHVKVVAKNIRRAITAREKLPEKEAALQQALEALQPLDITVQDLQDLQELQKHQTDNTTTQSQASSKSTKTIWGGISLFFTNLSFPRKKPSKETNKKYLINTKETRSLSTPPEKISVGGPRSKSQPLLERKSTKGGSKQLTSKSL